MKKEEPALPRLKLKRMKEIVGDPVKSAKAVNLVYTTDSQPGIIRIRTGKTFDYRFNNKKLRDKEHLARIKSLVLPPAWENVWICPLPDGHLQATGMDARQRKQYKYHALWSQLRNHTKFFRLYDFGKTLPEIRQRLESDLAKPGLPKEKVLALVVKLMELTNIRIGNNAYEKLYGSFGLTTLKDKHVKINSSKIEFSFKGKKGVAHKISIASKRFARMVKQCRDIPGEELFQYFDEQGQRHAIDSGAVNAYLKEITGQDFTAKDFRTWSGTTQAILAFKELGVAETSTGIQKNIVEALNNVSAALGNTRTVCKKYYVHPHIIKLYENQSLHQSYLNKLNEKFKVTEGLQPEEELLLTILRTEVIQ